MTGVSHDLIISLMEYHWYITHSSIQRIACEHVQLTHVQVTHLPPDQHGDKFADDKSSVNLSMKFLDKFTNENIKFVDRISLV